MGRGSLGQDNWNREHTYRNQMVALLTATLTRTDIHHLRPADESVNGRRVI